MTATTTTPPPADGSGDPKPAFERVARAWLAREVDGGQRLDPGELAREVSVTPRTAAATLAALRASRDRDPACERVRMLLARDQIQAAFVAAELRGDTRRLDPDELAREVGVTTTVARQWLRTLRAARHGDPTLAGLRGEPAERQLATPEQLAGLQAAYAHGGRPQLEPQPSAERALERIELLYRDQEQARGRRLDPGEVARQVGVGRAYAAQTLAALRGGTLTTAERIEQLWRVVERDSGRHLAAPDVARMLGVREGRVRQVLGLLRTRQRQQEQPAAPGRRLPLATTGDDGWLDQAACRDLPPGRFFPETGEHTKAAEAKAVCAGCQVREQCRDLAVKAAGSLDADHGVFGGTLPTERSPLRGKTFPTPSAYRQRRDLAAEAHELASRVGVRQAARHLGVHRDALAAAWTRWGLAQPQARAGWQPSAFLADRAQAERAYRLAERLGSVNAAAAELGTTWPTLRKAFTRHGLGMPTPDPAAVSARKAAAASRYHQPATPQLDGAFITLNRPLVAPLASRARPGELPARVRRAEQEATLGYRVTTRLTAENHWRSRTARAWAVRQRAQHAQQRAQDRASERQPERSPARPRRGRDEDQEGDRSGGHVRWRVHERGDGGAER